jgi:ribosomal-protein-alanine N-acetyltransferase
MDAVIKPITPAVVNQLIDLNSGHGELGHYMKSDAFWGMVALSSKMAQGMIYGWRDDDQVEIIQIVVHPDYRRSGLGITLLHHFIYDAKVKMCRLDVRADNTTALALYLKFGFVKDGVRKNYYRDQTGRTDAILMTYHCADVGEN